MDSEYIETLIQKFIEDFCDGMDVDEFERELRVIIVKICMHMQSDGIGEP